MSIIGYGPASSTGPAWEQGPVRASGSSVRPPAPPESAPVAPSTAAVVTASAPGADAPPIDQARVAAIRKAIQTNSYPVLPARVGDAMIAAGLVLRMPK